MAAIDYPQQGYGSPLQGLASISHEIMVFMRGHYRLDETGNGKDTLRFRQGGKTILTVYLRQDHLTFLVVLGQKERELFEAHREAFSPFLLAYYDVSKTHHDGKWLFIDVTTPEQLAEVKKLVLLKKKPNRKPFPTQTAVYGMCGQRCDLCIHYTGPTWKSRTGARRSVQCLRKWSPAITPTRKPSSAMAAPATITTPYVWIPAAEPVNA